MVEPIAAPTRPYNQFSLSPDGRYVAFGLPDGARNDIWTYDLIRNSFSRITFQGNNRFPIWTPDGTALTYTALKGASNVFQTLANGSGMKDQLTASSYSSYPNSWSPDGKQLVFAQTDPSRANDIWVMPIEGFNQARTFLQTAANEEQARVSPDGHWLAYLSNESGRDEVYVQAFPDPGGKWQISTEGGGEPLWSPNGKELFYRSGDKMVVEVSTQPSFRANTPRVLFEGQFAGPSRPLGFSAISPDGQHFLMQQVVEAPQPATQINFVQNWSEELKRLVPTTQ